MLLHYCNTNIRSSTAPPHQVFCCDLDLNYVVHFGIELHSTISSQQSLSESQERWSNLLINRQHTQNILTDEVHPATKTD